MYSTLVTQSLDLLMPMDGLTQVRPAHGAHRQGLQRLCTATAPGLLPDEPAESTCGETVGGCAVDGGGGAVEIERRLPITRWE